jgi:hypothetical protein
MSNLTRMFELTRQVQAQGAMTGGDVRVSREYIQQLLETLADAIRTTGGDVPKSAAAVLTDMHQAVLGGGSLHGVRAATVEDRLRHLERVLPFLPPAGVLAEMRTTIDRVSEGAQRDSADLHKRLERIEPYFKDEDGSYIPITWSLAASPSRIDALGRRLAAIEKRLTPPNPEDSWALLLPNEATAAIEQLQKEFAEMRGLPDVVHEWSEAFNRRLKGVDIELGSLNARLTRGLRHLNEQWSNLRRRLSALLSWDRDGSGTEGTSGGTPVG